MPMERRTVRSRMANDFPAEAPLPAGCLPPAGGPQLEGREPAPAARAAAHVQGADA